MNDRFPARVDVVDIIGPLLAERDHLERAIAAPNLTRAQANALGERLCVIAWFLDRDEATHLRTLELLVPACRTFTPPTGIPAAPAVNQ